MSAQSEELFGFLEKLGIRTRTVTHPPLRTVAESQALRGGLDGGHTKNLFLKDKKDNYFLLTVGEEANVDLKQVHHVIGAASKVSFGKPEKLMEFLGVEPGAVTALGVFCDTGQRVKIFLDEALMRHTTINCHPLVNDATTQIARDDLVAFIEATGHKATILKLAD